MLKEEKSKYDYEVRGGKKEYATLISGESAKPKLSVKELRNFLNELIDAGYGDYSVEASDIEDNLSSYSVGNEVLAYDLSKVIRLF